jgi:hypothetical protein
MAAEHEPDDVECDDEGRGGRRIAKRRGRFRIPVRFGNERAPVPAGGTPCAIAWASPKLQPILRRWLEEKIAERRITVSVTGEDGRARAAVFVRGAREVGGRLCTTLEDSIKGTVFCGKEILDAGKDRRDGGGGSHR